MGTRLPSWLQRLRSAIGQNATARVTGSRIACIEFTESPGDSGAAWGRVYLLPRFGGRVSRHDIVYSRCSVRVREIVISFEVSQPAVPTLWNIAFWTTARL